LRYKLPFPITKFEALPEYFTYSYFKNYNQILIPDTEEPNSLTGALSHHMRFLPKEKLVYCGILNDIQIKNSGVEKDIDYFIIVSGPEPQRTKLQKIIFNQVNELQGKIVVALGMPERKFKIRQGNAVFYSYLNREKMHDFMKRCKFIVSRPGYTTVMEMIHFNLMGLFIPTPGQIEQVYLSEYYEEKKWCHSVSQYKLDLQRDVENAKLYKGFPSQLIKSEENVKTLVEKYFA
jgi:predicted glycosyltransferase